MHASLCYLICTVLFLRLTIFTLFYQVCSVFTCAVPRLSLWDQSDVCCWMFTCLKDFSSVINISTERLKWHPMLSQMWESIFHQLMNMRVASNTHTIQSFDWSQWHCALWRYVTNRILSRPIVILCGLLMGQLNNEFCLNIE